MKLVELDPVWIFRQSGPDMYRAVGVRFICPNTDGEGPHREGHSVCVLFANPVDGGPPHPNDPDCPGNSGGRRWQRTGDTFETMSLSPSVDCTTAEGCPASDHAACSHTHCWHGHVQNGEITGARTA